MSDEPSKPVHDNHPPAWRKWLKWTTNVMFLLICLPVLRVAWLLRPGDARHDIEVGPETTVVAGPLTPEGFIDFTASLNEQASAGVTPDNNAVVLLMQAYGPGIIPPEHRARYFELLGVPMPPENGSCLLDERGFLAAQGIGDDHDKLAEHLFPLQDAIKESCQRPWTRDEFPRVGEMLDANRVPLEMVSAASQRTRFYSPMTGQVFGTMGPIFGTNLPVEVHMREAARCLQQRVLLRLGERNVGAACEDLLALHRLARLTGQSPSIVGLLIGYALEAIASYGDEKLIRSGLLSADDARRYLAELDALLPFPSVADVVDGPGRLEGVETIYGLAAGSPEILDSSTQRFGAARLARALDWNGILKMLNEQVDRSVEAMRLPDAAERAAAFAKLEQERHQGGFRMSTAVWALFGRSEPITREIGALLVDMLSHPVQVKNAEVRSGAYGLVIRTGLALVIFEREQGKYPATLDELSPEIPLDPYTGAALTYKRSANGCLLYSVGDNLKDDGGATYEDASPEQQAPPDDIRIRVGEVSEGAPVTE